ncbi:MAG: putative ABC transporter ATP-binding protein YxlF [Anaerolineales bacterium]|nr:putative ABC transporter ATP-binding protein YxlF [Anaerolineales bacterium]
MIEVENLTKHYGDFVAIEDVSFHVPRGEVLGFLGPNGAGKTTTMRILTGFMPPTDGRATVAGFDVFHDSLEVRRRIGYLPETVPLYPEMTVEGYLDFVAQLRSVDERWDSIDRVMEQVDIVDRADDLIGQLSKGYRQRVGLAQALVHNPEVIVLDEPTLGLDPKQIIEVRELIRSLSGERTVILSTHILPEVSQICERVLIINKGRIVAEDTPEQLSTRLEGAEHVRVTLDPSADGVAEVLGAIDGVEGVGQVGNGSYDITCALDVELRPILARRIVERGWSLLELRPVGMGLEDVFLQLTTETEETREPEPAVETVETEEDVDTEPVLEETEVAREEESDA